jgi:NAD(P)-dependent dehydrogenase (short-subunit alcohol dehydrogenase family)
MVMKELARAYGPHGIRVNAIAPGAIPGVGFPAGPETLVDKLRWDESACRTILAMQR